MCLLGDNGAGKSTLIKTLSGVHKPDEGEIIVEGKKTVFDSPRDALDMGIATVYQDLALVSLMSVTRNFFMGREPMKGFGPFKTFDVKKANSIASERMGQIGIDVRDPSQAVGTMSGGERQCLAISRAIYFGANRTFMYNHVTQIAQMMKFLDNGYYVTIDYPYQLHSEVKKRFSSIWNREKFIPFCSIIFADSEEDDNLCIKIDDKDFNKTNPGVWTMTMNNFKQSSGFTSWKEYKQDQPIQEKKWLLKIPHTQ